MLATTDTARDNASVAIDPSYWHRHCGFVRASSRRSAGGTDHSRAATLTMDTELLVHLSDVQSRLSVRASRAAGHVGPVGQTRGQNAVVRPLRRLTGTCRRPPIGWP